MRDRFDTARRAAQRGGEVALKFFQEGFQLSAKGLNNLVTDADVAAERAIVDAIRSDFPGDAVFAEETHRDDVAADNLWIVDPIDGTHNFAHHVPQFGVSVAYYERGQPRHAVVYQPVGENWYTASRGQGAYCNDKLMHVAAEQNLSEVLIGIGFPYDREGPLDATLAAIRKLFAVHVHGVRRNGAATLDLCSVAAGQFGAFFEYGLAAWDFAAGRLIVEEAGGRVTTCEGEPLPIAQSTVLATNGHLHEAMLEICK